MAPPPTFTMTVEELTERLRAARRQGMMDALTVVDAAVTPGATSLTARTKNEVLSDVGHTIRNMLCKRPYADTPPTRKPGE